MAEYSTQYDTVTAVMIATIAGLLVGLILLCKLWRDERGKNAIQVHIPGLPIAVETTTDVQTESYESSSSEPFECKKCNNIEPRGNNVEVKYQIGQADSDENILEEVCRSEWLCLRCQQDTNFDEYFDILPVYSEYLVNFKWYIIAEFSTDNIWTLKPAFFALYQSNLNRDEVFNRLIDIYYLYYVVNGDDTRSKTEIRAYLLEYIQAHQPRESSRECEHCDGFHNANNGSLVEFKVQIGQADEYGHYLREFDTMEWWCNGCQEQTNLDGYTESREVLGTFDVNFGLHTVAVFKSDNICEIKPKSYEKYANNDCRDALFDRLVNDYYLYYVVNGNDTRSKDEVRAYLLEYIQAHQPQAQ